VRGAEAAPPAVEASATSQHVAAVPKGRGAAATPTPTAGKEPVTSAPVAVPAWKKLLRRVLPADQAPGQEEIARSPLVLALVLALAVLVLTGIGLWNVIAKTTAERQYRQAFDALNEGDYRSAIVRFDQFLKTNPRDPRAAKARVFRALANVRQYATGAGPVWSSALDAARKMVKEVGKEPAYRDASTELAELVLKAAEGLADRAKATGDEKDLQEVESAVVLHSRIAGEAAEKLRENSRLPRALNEARAAVRKAQVRAQALAAMDAAIKEESAAKVFEARDALVKAYPDLANDRATIERMTRANEFVRRAVTFDATRRPAETEEHPEPLGPPTSLVLRSRPGDGPTKNGPLVYALADGIAYALDGTNGAPVWQRPVGLSAPFPPQAVPGGGESIVLVVDARHDELLRLDGRTGRLRWRQSLGEPVSGPPLVLGLQVIQPIPSGQLLLIDLNGGEVKGSIRLGRPIAASPVADEAGLFFYVLADESSLFVLRRDPPECVAVEYLGHASGSIACPPARVGRYLIVPENSGIDSGRWTVFILDEEGAKLRQAQTLPIPGWTWSTPASSGSVLWSADDRGSVAAYALGPYEAKEPLKLIAKLAAESKASGPAFARAKTEREAWIASSRSARYDLNLERGELATAWTLGVAGRALAPIQPADRLAVLTQQVTDGPGVALWGVNPADGSVVWRTTLGAPWPIPLTPTADGEGLMTLANDGQARILSRSDLAAGGFVEGALPKPGNPPVIPPHPDRRLEAAGLEIVVPELGSNYLLVRAGEGEFRKVELPAPLAASPIFWSEGLFVPGGDGRAYLIDPKTGRSLAEPFVPPFEVSRPAKWLAPALLKENAVVLADTTGRLRRVELQQEPVPRLVSPIDPADLGSPLAAPPASTGEAVLAVTEDGKVRILAARDLSPSGAIPLEAPLRLGPYADAGHAFVADAAGHVLAFGPDGQKLWAIELRDGPPVGAPAVGGDTVWFLGHDGSLERRSLADGSALDRIALDLIPTGGPLPVGPDLVVPVGRGTVRLFAAKTP
ncbi:MAG: PQQ-binding-like beta-propeller repeat protein, partial [Isosphaeraceae bacterium]|nr:PQQ-binding-like beta-propeller repeat protein [Isosphaeraceae bacterium]